MRRGIVGTLLVLATIAGSSQAQARDRQVSIPFIASKGDRFKVAVSVDEKTTLNGMLDSHTTRSSTYSGVIDAARKGRYRMTWTLRTADAKVEVDRRSRTAVTHEVMTELNKSLVDKPISFEADASGVPIRIVDWPNVAQQLAGSFRSAIAPSLHRILAARAPQLRPHQIAEAVATQAEQMAQDAIFRHDERSAVALLSEATLIGAVQNRRLDREKPTTGDEATFARLSKVAVNQTTEVRLAEFDKAKDFAEIRFVTTYDDTQLKATAAEAVKARAGETFGALAKKKRAAAQARLDRDIKQLTVERQDSGSARVELKKGWAQRIEQTKEVYSGVPGASPDRQVTTLTIVVDREDPPPARKSRTRRR